METQKYSRRPFDVEAVRVTKDNMDEVAEWCQGTVVETEATETSRAERFIQVEVHTPANERQSRAFPGDFVLLLEGGKSYKVYTTKAFNKNFVLSENQESTPAPTAKKTAKKRTPRKKTQPERPPANGINAEGRAALRKMGEGMKKAAASTTDVVFSSEKDATEQVKAPEPAPTGKDETPAAPVELTTEQTPAHSHDPEHPSNQKPADSPELQVVERPVENTTEPKLEVTEAPAVKPDGTKRKFIQKTD